MKRAVLFLALGAVLVAVGVMNDQHIDVMNKAAMLCLECVGIG